MPPTAVMPSGIPQDRPGPVPLLDLGVDGDVRGQCTEAGHGDADLHFSGVPVLGRNGVQDDDPHAAIARNLTCQVERVRRGAREVRRVQQGLDWQHGVLLFKKMFPIELLQD
jgi:hypothetical protein